MHERIACVVLRAKRASVTRRASRAQKSSTMEFAGAGDMDGKPEG
jgi:hypothetical protein